MKIRSPIFSEMLGKLGDAVGSQSRGGINYLRKLVVPANPQTEAQLDARAAMAAAASYWRGTLLQALRDAWQAASAGSQTGISLFTSINSMRLRAGQPIITAVPPAFSTALTTPGQIVISATAGLTLVGVAATDPWNDAGLAVGEHTALFVSVTAQQAPSQFARRRSFRIVRIEKRTNLSPQVTQVDVDLAALKYALTAGNVMYLRLAAQDKFGATSVRKEYRIVIEA